MLKKHMAACLVATALVAAPALAQTTQPPPPSAGTDRPLASGTGSTATGSSAMQPGVVGSPAGGAPAATGTAAGTTTPTPPAATPAPTGTAGTTAPAAPPPATGTATTTTTTAPATQTTVSSAGAAQGQFLTQLQPTQVMASKLIGTTVVGANNESIGDVNDVILDRNGQTMAVLIGVGGFLGIGEKDVAVSFKELEFASSEQMNRQTSGATPGTTGAGTAAGSGVATTGSTATTGATGTGTTTTTAAGAAPDRILLRMTKAELEAAPTFNRSGRATDSGNAGTTGAGSTPGARTTPARP